MRIIAGKYRSRKLHSPQGDQTRPTEDRIKESIFNMLGPIAPTAKVLDLCAGSGAMGLEFLSRGAEHATLVDESKEAIACIRKNITTLQLEDQTTICYGNADKALKHLASEDKTFDYIYLDPPYDKRYLYTKLIRRMAELDVLKRDGWLLVEAKADYPLTDDLPADWQAVKSRQYRGTVIYFITHKE